MLALKLRFLATVCVLLAGLGWSNAFGEEPPADTAPADERGPDVEREKDPVERRGDRRAMERDDFVGRAGSHLVTQLTKLREEMADKLELKNSQERKIEELFETHIATLRRKNEEAKADAADRGSPAELKAIREQIKEARDRGDDKAVDELRAQMREKMMQRAGAQDDGTKEFLDTIRAELDEKQTAEFNKFVVRLRLEGGPRHAASGLGALSRAVNNPEVGLNAEQRRKVLQLIQEGVRKSEPRKWTEESADKTVDTIREDVFKELTSEQRAKVEELLAADQERMSRQPRERLRRNHEPPNRTPHAEQEESDKEGEDD